jgi:hypothetical protein
MTDERGYIIDRYGYTADDPRWRDINDSWVYVGKGGLHAYVKVIDGQIMPDVQVLTNYAPCQSWRDYMEKLEKARGEM